MLNFQNGVQNLTFDKSHSIHAEARAKANSNKQVFLILSVRVRQRMTSSSHFAENVLLNI